MTQPVAANRGPAVFALLLLPMKGRTMAPAINNIMAPVNNIMVSICPYSMPVFVLTIQVENYNEESDDSQDI